MPKSVRNVHLAVHKGAALDFISYITKIIAKEYGNIFILPPTLKIKHKQLVRRQMLRYKETRFLVTSKNYGCWYERVVFRVNIGNHVQNIRNL